MKNNRFRLHISYVRNAYHFQKDPYSYSSFAKKGCRRGQLFKRQESKQSRLLFQNVTLMPSKFCLEKQSGFCQILPDMSGIVLASLLGAVKKALLYISGTSLHCSSSVSPFLSVTGLIFYVQSARSSMYLAGRKENATKPRCYRGMFPLSTLWEFFHMSIIPRLMFPSSVAFYVALRQKLPISKCLLFL